MRRLLAGARVFTGDRIVDGHTVVLEGDRVAAVLPAGDAPSDARARRLPADSLLVPGFIDVQINGAGGVLFNDTPTVDAALAIAAVVRRTGTTSILPTLITDETSKLQQACDAAALAIGRPAGGVLGVHLEGPFLSHERPGVHPARWMRRPDASDIALLVAAARRFDGRGRLLITLAPECVDDADIAQLAAAGIIVAAGHTAATVERTREALAAGVRGFTHLGNAMPPIANRQPGPIVAALADPDAWCCIIVDGLHVHPALLRLVVQVKPPGKVVVVTDAMPTVGSESKEFVLQGKRIVARDGACFDDNGRLAGSDLDMARAVRNAIGLLDLAPETAFAMASAAPAAFLRLDRELGRIAPDCRADLALLDDALTVRRTWIGGEPSA